jgi:hypothetical protein
MFVHDEVMQLFSVDGKAIRKVRTGKMNSAHIGEESIGVRPFRAVTQVVVFQEQL